MAARCTTAADKSPEKNAQNIWAKLCDDLNVDKNWKSTLIPIFEEVHIERTLDKLQEKKEKGEEIYPPVSKLFSWTKWCKPHEVKVVIIGQDPVADGRANGTAFTFEDGEDRCMSITNLQKLVPGKKKLLKVDHAKQWSTKGVLMLNNIPTIGRESGVKSVSVDASDDDEDSDDDGDGTPDENENDGEYKSLSSESDGDEKTDKGQRVRHKSIGWESFTKALIKKLIQSNKPLVFIQLGVEARTNLKDLMKTYTVCQKNTKFKSYKDDSLPTNDEYKPAGEKAYNLSLVYPHPAASSWSKHTKENNGFIRANEHLEKFNISRIPWESPYVVDVGQLTKEFEAL